MDSQARLACSWFDAHAEEEQRRLGRRWDNVMDSVGLLIRNHWRRTMPKILLIQGPNMSYLGRRQPELYGETTAAELDAMLLGHARANKYELGIFYTQSESEAIARLYRAVDEGIDGLVMNPAAFLFAGFALRDCLRAVPLPYVEVHMTNIEKRGLRSILAETGVGLIAGFGVQSYVLGLEAMLRHVSGKREARSRPPRKRGRSRARRPGE